MQYVGDVFLDVRWRVELPLGESPFEVAKGMGLGMRLEFVGGGPPFRIPRVLQEELNRERVGFEVSHVDHPEAVHAVGVGEMELLPEVR